MTTRRDGRPSQVRPRPPSTGRPAPAKVRPRGPTPGRLAAHRRVERTRRLALPFQLLFAVAVVALCGAVLFAATGGVGRVAGALGSTFTGFFADLTATPVPSETPSILSDTPLLEEPAEPYTNQATVDLVGSLPTAVVGSEETQVRIRVKLGDQEPGIVTQVPVGRGAQFIVPGITLIEGSNVFTATLVGPTGESEASPPITYILDTAAPKITISSPKNGAVVNAKTVQLLGVTQPRSQLQARNASTNATVTNQADANGKFALLLPIGAGTNDIGITAIDPAGNENHVVMAVRQGSGKLAASLTPSAVRIRLSALPERIRLSVVVSDPDGRVLERARVTFSLAVPGISAITSPTLLSGGDGTATWTTTIPKGASAGQIKATAIVTTTRYGTTTDLTVISIVK